MIFASQQDECCEESGAAADAGGARHRGGAGGRLRQTKQDAGQRRPAHGESASCPHWIALRLTAAAAFSSATKVKVSDSERFTGTSVNSSVVLWIIV